MSTIIDAGSAKLAGLQIDTLSKYRAGLITIGQWERFNNLSSDEREARFGDWKQAETAPSAESPVPSSKFTKDPIKVLKVTIPTDYKHDTHLATFNAENRDKFLGYDDKITDENFAQVTHKLVPGKTYTVKIFGVLKDQDSSSVECLAKYREERALFTGAQGVSFVWKQHRKALPKGKWYASFDEKDKLPVDNGHLRVPCVLARWHGDFNFDLADFEGGWRDYLCFVCFYDETQPSEPSQP